MRALLETILIALLAAYLSALFVGAGVMSAGFYAGYELNDVR